MKVFKNDKHWSIQGWCSNHGQKHVFLILWLSINGYLFWCTFKSFKYGPQYYYLHEMLGVSLCISRSTASVINLNLGALLLPMCRSFTSCLRGIICKPLQSRIHTQLDHAKGFHITCAVLVVVASAIHTFAHVVNAHNYSKHYNARFTDLNAASTPYQSPLMIVLTSVPGVTGILMVLVLTLIISSSTLSVRQSSFNIFWYTHRLYMVLYLLILVHAFRGILKAQKNLSVHTPGCMRSNGSVGFAEPEPEAESSAGGLCDEMPTFETVGSSSWMWLAGPLFIYGCDVFYRFIKIKKCEAKVLQVIQHPQHILEIHLYKEGLEIKPGQFVLLQCPQISTFEWHPYSVSKCPSFKNSSFTVHVKTTGDWSGKLNDNIPDENCEDNSQHLLPNTGFTLQSFYVDGPFSSPMEDMSQYKICLLIAGGIGITPFSAFLNKLRTCNSSTKIPQRIYILWLCRHVESFYCFVDLFEDIHQMFWEENKPDLLDIQFYLTQQTQNDLECIQPYQGQRRAYNFLSKRLHFGRPKWEHIFQTVIQSHTGSKIGVFSCGPKSLSHTISKWCSRVKKNGSTYHSYHESF